MKAGELSRVLAVLFVSSAITACGSSPTSRTTAPNTTAVIEITVRKATVAPITAPENGWLYRVQCEVREAGGKTGATVTLGHWALSNGFTTDSNFSGPGVLQTPHVVAGSTITVESTLSVMTTAPPATHLVFAITYTGDDGLTGSATTDVDISQVSSQ